ncbi:MAG: hypothetical protein H0V44_14010 [Planctomycetes bacterium]|nr:hypothetical protein [Planctomycetota bacterium]
MPHPGCGPFDLLRRHAVVLVVDGHGDDPHPGAAQFPPGMLHTRAPDERSLRWIPMSRGGLAEGIASTADLPVIRVPRVGPSPLRVSYSAANDGSADRMTATIVNDCRVAFPTASLRFVLRAGTYRASEGRIVRPSPPTTARRRWSTSRSRPPPPAPPR